LIGARQAHRGGARSASKILKNFRKRESPDFGLDFSLVAILKAFKNSLPIESLAWIVGEDLSGYVSGKNRLFQVPPFLYHPG
jgi:hypothetical protein